MEGLFSPVSDVQRHTARWIRAAADDADADADAATDRPRPMGIKVERVYRTTTT
eukprot:COSAG04_NODE_22976_length_346_cov_0.627530_1_plen_53_part_10